SNQNSRWQNMDRALKAQSATLQNQDSRMLNIEHQMSEMMGLKDSVTRMEAKIKVLDSDIYETNITVNTYQESIDMYSDTFDKIMKDRDVNESIVNDLQTRMSKLELQQSKLQEEQSLLYNDQKRSENTLTDLQCRCMRDNLVFTGISEVQLSESDEYEDVENTLTEFLNKEMGINRHIGYHRVHRIGAYDKETANQYPRSIIAKFEKFKAREYIRSRAKDTLKGKKYGIREQFPRQIEIKRKQLYPIAKEARKNTNNKVRLIRDRLFVNNEEVIVESLKASEPRFEKGRTEHDRQTNPANNERSSYRGGRTFYRGKGARKGFIPRQTETAKLLDFSVPISNTFGMLSEYNETPIRRTASNSSMAGKHPASSPLDAEYVTKKQRDDAEINLIDMDVDNGESKTEPPLNHQSKEPSNSGHGDFTLISETTIADPPNLAVATENLSESAKSNEQRTEIKLGANGASAPAQADQQADSEAA
ncbi:MAG: hypothetical protein N0E48_16250, partial [Candidatus Thiodiazotropha endolucinida]|nr:hypothetical protein [Candidatus Thiodiazotropha taylori]MCW4344884.1 hypothetical protein [Candidatus Thiodiazotropha endolucinida]